MDTGKLAPIVQLPRDADFMTDEAFAKLRALACTPGAIERLLECASRMPTLESRCVQLESRCNQLQSTCDAWDRFCESYICPGNVNYSQRTLDEYSDNAQVDLDQIVTGLGGDYVNAFPVPPGKIIRLQHKARPGYTPQKIAIDLNIAGGGQNYLDFLIQFYLVPGGTGSDLGLELGSQMRGNQFLNKDGTQIHLKFPEYRAQPIDVGSLEMLAINIKNTGAANNLDSAFVTVYYDNRAFYELCKKRCGCLIPGAK